MYMNFKNNILLLLFIFKINLGYSSDFKDCLIDFNDYKALGNDTIFFESSDRTTYFGMPKIFKIKTGFKKIKFKGCDVFKIDSTCYYFIPTTYKVSICDSVSNDSIQFKVTNYNLYNLKIKVGKKELSNYEINLNYFKNSHITLLSVDKLSACLKNYFKLNINFKNSLLHIVRKNKIFKKIKYNNNVFKYNKFKVGDRIHLDIRASINSIYNLNFEFETEAKSFLVVY